jgi:hypothetical protein
MFARILSSYRFTREEKALAFAYVAILAMCAGLAVFVVSSIASQQTGLVLNGTSWFLPWTLLSGAVGGCAGLYIARGWMGLVGLLGFARALVGSIVILFIGSAVAGTLMAPIYGTLVGPVLAVAGLISLPWLGLGWLVVVGAAQVAFVIAAKERAAGHARGAERAMSQLSALSQAHFYRHNANR